MKREPKDYIIHLCYQFLERIEWQVWLILSHIASSLFSIGLLMMGYKRLPKFSHSVSYCKSERKGAVQLKEMLYHSSRDSNEEISSYEWYGKVFKKITKLTHLLKNVDLIDGRMVNIKDDSIIIDGRMEQRMRTYKSLVRAFIGCPSVQQTIQKNVAAALGDSNCAPFVCFSKPSEREAMIVNSLTMVSNYLQVSAQQRKTVRLTISPQVTQHRIWAGAIDEILNELKFEIDLLNDQCPTKGTEMGQQIVSSCLKYLTKTQSSHDPESTSWMKLAPAKAVDSPALCKWEEVLKMFNDLIKCLDSERELLYHVSKLDVMKEGLAQIKDVLVDKRIGYKEVRLQESLVQKKLSKTLGHSSRCLFTLLVYYLHRQVRDIEVDVCGGIYASTGGGDNKYTMCMGRILTSDEEKKVWSGVKQLDRALGLFKFVWETAGMKGVLDLQGHLWSVGAVEKSFTYRGNAFFIHGVGL